jgi:hypothetical protein
MSEQSVIEKMLDAVDRHVAAGEAYSWSRESSFFGPNVRMQITSKRGDLCDLRNELERIAGVFGQRRSAAARPAPDTQQET